MKDLYRRWIVSLMLPFVFLVGFPVVAIVLKDTDRIPGLAVPPLKSLSLICGVLSVLVGVRLLFATIPLFLRLNAGTNMPWEPAPELIVEGVYRHVRNPMHVGVFLVMMGEGLILQSVSILGFSVFAAILHLFYIPYSEERGLEARFGETYRIYKAHVPRWLPRWTPWIPEGNTKRQRK